MSEMSFDAVVVGAGIVGASCAWQLMLAGERVAVIDAGAPGMVATAAGMGHIVVMDDSPAIFALTVLSRKTWDEVAPALPKDAVYFRPGTAWVAENDAELAIVRSKHAFYRDRGIEAEMLDAAELATREPNLRRGMLGALVIPGDAVVYAPAAARWMVEQVCSSGGAFITGAPVVALSGGRAELSDGRVMTGKITVNAAGAAAPLLTPGLPIRARKGHLIMTERAPGFCRYELIELGYLTSCHGRADESVAFNVQPRADGQVLIGASRQFGSHGPDLEPRILKLMLDRCTYFMPTLSTLRHEKTWTGFRPASADSLPLIGPHPRDPRLFIAAGHEGLGITGAIASGRLVADLALGRTPPIPHVPYLPSRFSF